MNKKYRNQNNRYGFTLVETMTSLMIFSIVVSVIFLVVQELHHEFESSSETQFYLYLNVIEDNGFKLKHHYPQRLDLIKGRKSYIVKFANHKLIMSTNKGGYSPILDNVNIVNWYKKNGALISDVQMTSGEHFDGKSYLRGE